MLLYDIPRQPISEKMRGFWPKFAVTIPVTRLKFGSFPYLYSMNFYAKFQGFLKTWVSGPYYLSLFDVEFPFMKAFKAFIKPFETPQISMKIKI